MAPALDVPTSLALLERMLLIRRFEERLVHLREEEQLIRGHYHVSIGQEATAAAACAQLRTGDSLFTTHRNHGHILARGGGVEPLLAEILGRATGSNGGRGGTLHPAFPELGILHTSSIVGGSLPLAAGAALSARRLRPGSVSLAIFGDGVLEEGAFYEALNLAHLWRLPLVLLCENNGVPAALRCGGPCPSGSHGAQRLTDVAASFSVPASVVDGAELEAVWAGVGDAIERARQGGGPSFVEARTTPWPGNERAYPSLPGGDTHVAWAWDESAVPPPLADWCRDSDPLLLAARRLLAAGGLTREELLSRDEHVSRQVAEAAAAARSAPLPDPGTALAGVFAQEEED